MVNLTKAEQKETKGIEAQAGLHSNIKDFINFNNQLGLKNLFYGIDYQRTLEYPTAFNQLKLNDSIENLLDIGTGKHSILPLFITTKASNVTIRMTDWGDYVFKQLKRINRHSILKKQHSQGKLIIEKQDTTKLTYEDDYFDRVSAISVIEHIPDNGDSEAVQEMYRVLKKDGRIVITVPYQFENYEAKFRERNTYFKKYKGEPIFFSHYYDDESLKKRILDVTEAEVENITYLGERDFPYFDFWCNKVPLRNLLKYFIGWINQYIALKYYKMLDYDERQKAHVAVLTLIKR